MGEESYTWYRVRGWSRPGGFSLFGGWLTLPLLWFIHISHLQTQVFHFGVTTRHQHHQHPPLSHIHTGRKKKSIHNAVICIRERRWFVVIWESHAPTTSPHWQELSLYGRDSVPGGSPAHWWCGHPRSPSSRGSLSAVLIFVPWPWTSR